MQTRTSWSTCSSRSRRASRKTWQSRRRARSRTAPTTTKSWDPMAVRCCPSHCVFSGFSSFPCLTPTPASAAHACTPQSRSPSRCWRTTTKRRMTQYALAPHPALTCEPSTRAHHHARAHALSRSSLVATAKSSPSAPTAKRACRTGCVAPPSRSKWTVRLRRCRRHGQCTARKYSLVLLLTCRDAPNPGALHGGRDGQVPQDGQGAWRKRPFTRRTQNALPNNQRPKPYPTIKRIPPECFFVLWGVHRK